MMHSLQKKEKGFFPFQKNIVDVFSTLIFIVEKNLRFITLFKNF